MKIITKKRIFCGSTQLVVSSPLSSIQTKWQNFVLWQCWSRWTLLPSRPKICDQVLEKILVSKQNAGAASKGIEYMPQSRKSLFRIISDKHIFEGETPKTKCKLTKYWRKENWNCNVGAQHQRWYCFANVIKVGSLDNIRYRLLDITPDVRW